jgi:hypothetical protein
METLTRLVTDSLARHGFDRPVDPRRLQWSRWFRCDSPHSLLVVPSKPGIFAIAEEVMDFAPSTRHTDSTPGNTHMDFSPGKPHVGTAAPGCPPEQSSGMPSPGTISAEALLGGAALQRCDSPQRAGASAPEAPARRMLAVLQFSEDDDMAFTLDRMFTRINPMRSRLSSGRCFLRFVTIEDQDQRRSICSALNQWMVSSAEKATGIPAAFSSSVEISMAGDTVSTTHAGASSSPAPVAIHAGSNKNLHCSQPLPSGF